MKLRIFLPFFLILFSAISCLKKSSDSIHSNAADGHKYNQDYTGEYLNRIAFPLGGIGAGMVCLEGTGGISHVSVRNKPDMLNEPLAFAALCVKGKENIARVLEGPAPRWKLNLPESGNGLGGTDLGLPRFKHASFLARFPFATVKLSDEKIPFQVEITGWSPFIPGDADNSSLPVGAMEYRFINNSGSDHDAVFTFNSINFMRIPLPSEWGGTFEEGAAILPLQNGFILSQSGVKEHSHYKGAFAIFANDENVSVDHCWFRGGWFDALTVAWKNIQEGNAVSHAAVKGASPGASLYVPFSLKSGQEKTIKLLFAWYAPNTDIRIGEDASDAKCCPADSACCPSNTYKPWYAGRFNKIEDVTDYWQFHFDVLREKSALFRDTFYSMTLPDEVIEAVAANLTILKSPTVLRQADGRLWAFEGCKDDRGCCHGSCTHVWNYAQAIPHLFPALERTLRETEFKTSQNTEGHQTFRTNLPIRPVAHTFHAAADGQLGGIMKIYREWRISGDTRWMTSLWPAVKQSLDYCIQTWDPKGKGIVEEPHHNTYDIEFWGPDGMCTGFYLGALTAAIEMGKEAGDDMSQYVELLEKGRQYLQTELFDGEYFYQKVVWQGLESPDPVEASKNSWTSNYSEEAIELLQKEGPKYQYGTGCISDGVLGFWLARMSGLGEIADVEKVKSHLMAVYKYNLKHDLSDHINPQRPSYAMGTDGGLLLCTWPKGSALTLPFVYSNEVWTGIEYQVASHLMLEGMVQEGLDIVRTCRDRYDGIDRNSFDEYECGHWYARAMSSYGLLQGLTGVRYDAVDKTLYIDSRLGENFQAFLSTATGFGLVGLKNNVPFVQMKMGVIDVQKTIVSGKEVKV